jgi:hypothetical protein
VAAARAGQALPEGVDRPLTAKEGDALSAALIRLRQVCSLALWDMAAYELARSDTTTSILVTCAD